MNSLITPAHTPPLLLIPGRERCRQRERSQGRGDRRHVCVCVCVCLSVCVCVFLCLCLLSVCVSSLSGKGSRMPGGLLGVVRLGMQSKHTQASCQPAHDGAVGMSCIHAKILCGFFPFLYSSFLLFLQWLLVGQPFILPHSAWSIHPSVRPPIHASMHLFIHSSIHPCLVHPTPSPRNIFNPYFLFHSASPLRPPPRFAMQVVPSDRSAGDA